MAAFGSSSPENLKQIQQRRWMKSNHRSFASISFNNICRYSLLSSWLSSWHRLFSARVTIKGPIWSYLHYNQSGKFRDASLRRMSFPEKLTQGLRPFFFFHADGSRAESCDSAATARQPGRPEFAQTFFCLNNWTPWDQRAGARSQRLFQGAGSVANALSWSVTQAHLSPNGALAGRVFIYHLWCGATACQIVWWCCYAVMPPSSFTFHQRMWKSSEGFGVVIIPFYVLHPSL